MVYINLCAGAILLKLYLLYVNIFNLVGVILKVKSHILCLIQNL